MPVPCVGINHARVLSTTTSVIYEGTSNRHGNEGAQCGAARVYIAGALVVTSENNNGNLFVKGSPNRTVW